MNKFYILLLCFLPISLILGNTISLLLLVLLFVVSFNILKKKNKIEIIYHEELKLLLVLYLYLIMNTFFSTNYENSILRNFTFFRHIFLIITTIYLLQNKKSYQTVLFFWTIISLIISLDIFYEFLNGKNILGFSGPQGSWGKRIVSFFETEQIVGGFLLSFGLLATGFLFEHNNNKKIIFLNYLIPLIFLIAILLTGERASFIKIIAGIFLFFIFTKRINYKTKIIFFLLSTIFLIFTFYKSNFLKVRFYGQFLNNFTSIDKIKNFHEQNEYLKLYKSGILVFNENKYFGAGNKNYRKVCLEKFISFIDENKKNPDYVCSTHPHQLYFEILSEHGMIGSAIIFSILFYIIFKNIKIYITKRNNIHLASLCFVITNFIPFLPSGSFFTYLNSTLFWINFSFMIAASKLAIKNTK